MNGIILINKEKHYTSNDVVQIVKKLFKEKVGHTGTLDPIATGVLPLLIGKGTLVSKYLINHDKIYVATLKLGIKTDTGDITGNILEEKKVQEKCLQKDNIEKILKKFIGKQKQVPPMYSAIKVNGKKLYEYARIGQTIEVEGRDIEIYNIELLEIDKQNKEIKFRVYCSKGTYIRTLCENIAEDLENVGTMKELNREKVGEFSLEKAITLDELKNNFENKEFIDEKCISIEKLFSDKSKITLSKRAFISFINGAKLLSDEPNNIYRIYDIENKFLGIGIVKDGVLKRDVVV